jgi:hypothetical protein
MTKYERRDSQLKKLMAEDKSHPEMDYNAAVGYPHEKVFLCYFRW